MTNDNNRILTLPTLALRGVTAFPGQSMNFDVERPMSIAALHAAMGTDRMIFLVAQQDIELDAPRQKDLYTVGTVCRLGQILRISGGHTRAVVDGMHRAKLLRVTSETPCLWANIQILEDESADNEALETVALVRRVQDLFGEYARVSGTVSPEAVLRVVARKDSAFITNFIAQNVYFQPEDKQLVLEERDPVERLKLIVSLLSRELDIAELEHEIAEAAGEQLSQTQKDYFLREQLKVIREELGEGNEESEIEDYRRRVMMLTVTEEVRNKLLKEVERLSKQPFGSSEGAVLRGYLDVCLELPWNKRTAEITDLTRARKILDDDHYGLEKVKERIIEYLAVRRLSPEVKGGVLCLVGPPGVGKTSIAMSIARATNRKLARISLGGVHDEAEIRGHRKTYVGAMPGRIIAGIQQAGSCNPLLVLDEIDKLGSDYRGDPSAALLETLDMEQNSSFRDHFLELPFDLSETFFITTANTTDTIPRALLDRMEIIELGSYTDEEKLQIAKGHLLPKQRKKHGLSGHQLKLSDDCIREIIALYTRESGVRLLERELAAVCRKAARAIACGEIKSLRLKAGELEKYLGSPKYKPEGNPLIDTVGLVHGLAWTSVGGEMLDVECAVVPGSGKLELTGNLGEVMKESCQAAVTYIRGRTAELGIDPDFYKNTDIHLHFPEGAVPKDGPSAGCAITLCVVSALTGRAVRGDLAMTGEITLRGRVLPIGGVREKSMGALRAGIHDILLPEDNLPDLAEIDPGVRNAMHYTGVSHMDQVIALALRPAEERRSESAAQEESFVLPQEGTAGNRVSIRQ